MSERELFIAALQKNPHDLPAFLDQACASDPALRYRVQVLLKAHEMAGGILDLPGQTNTGCGEGMIPGAGSIVGTLDQDSASGPPRNGSSPRPTDEGPGTLIGPYKLLQEIGEGGMGTVYMAEQERPVRRKVALKIIKPGMGSAQVIARFEAERQALALMDHPNIARVLDAGTTDAGRPYFVMELVNGIPITAYCDKARLTPRERLELFIPVCQAIHHAHQKGVIHRDVKPTNVLVTLYDGKPVPKVIDFGIAKATDQRLTQKTMFTQFGSIVGTLEYMSPEQAEMSAQGVDTRSDIYSLGVLLYELLTGTTPLERARFREAAYVEILRRICEEEPPRPSARLSESKEALASISAMRRTEPGRLAKVVRGELDWIVMKALDKDRARRYESASGFAEDLRRHLDGDAVEACPPSASYRLRKLARRHRAALATASALAAMLLLAVFVSAWQAIRARQAERQAMIQAHQAVMARAEARNQKDQAGRSEESAQAVLKFLQDEILTAARPEGQDGGKGKDITIRKALDEAEPKITGTFQGQPTVEASVRETLGRSYFYLGEAKKAIREHERAAELLEARLGRDHPDTLRSRNNLALAYLSAGLAADAVKLIETTLKAQMSKLGSDHPDTLQSRNSLATAYLNSGRAAQAIALLEATLRAQESKLGPDHPDTLISRNNLAEAYRSAGRTAEAIALLEATLRARMSRLGPDHPDTLISRNNLAEAYRSAGRAAEAVPLLEATLRARLSKLGPDHPDTLISQDHLALAYQDAGQLERAIPLLQSTAESLRARLGANHPVTLAVQADLGWAFQQKGDLLRAEAIYRDILARRKPGDVTDQGDFANILAYLGSCLSEQKKWPEAEAVLRESLRIRDARNLSDDWERFHTLSELGGSLLGQKRYPEAEPLILSGYEGLKARESRIPRRARRLLNTAAERVAKLYEAWGMPEKADAWREKLKLPRAEAKRKP